METGVIKQRIQNGVFENKLSLEHRLLPELPSALAILRRQKGLSLRRMAQKVGIEKTRLLRLEKRSPDEISLGDLQKVALGLDLKPEDLFRYLRGSSQQGMVRSDRKSPFFVVEKGRGVRWASFTRRASSYFVGSLNLAPKASVSSSELPQGAFLFCMVLEGELLVSLGPQEYFFKAHDFFYLQEQLQGEFYNPHQLNPMTAFYLAFPSPERGGSPEDHPPLTPVLSSFHESGEPSEQP